MKADYSKIASTYDQAHPASEMAVDRVLTFLQANVAKKKDIKLLDLGCGTGRFAIPIAQKLNYHVVGADNSIDMLNKAKIKNGSEKISWELQDATGLTYEDNYFDIIFISHLLHHFDKPDLVIQECYRVLKSGGLLLNRYGAIEDILEDPEHKFFPEIAEIDRLRTPTKNQIEDWFKQIGFKTVNSECLEQQTFSHSQERLAAIERRYISALWLISDSAFHKGLKDFEEYIAANPDDQWPLKCKITFTSGIK